MAHTAGMKTCVVCGIDCAGKPRTKDSSGRYFCEGCVAEINAARREGRSLPPPRFDRRTQGQTSTTETPFPGMDVSLAAIADLMDLGDASSAPPTAQVQAACPSCAAPLPDDAQICVQCGRDRNLGQRLKTSTARHRAVGGRTIWPWFIGGFGCLIGGLGVASAIMQIITMLTTSSDFAVARMVGAALGLWITGLHLAGAVGTLRRHAIGPARMRLSSAIYLVLGMLVIGLGVLALAAASSTNAPMGAIVLSLVLMAVLILGWPLLVIIWTGLPYVRRDIASW